MCLTVIPRLHDTAGCEPVEQPVGQPAVSCKQTFNRMSNRLYRVKGVLHLRQLVPAPTN